MSRTLSLNAVGAMLERETGKVPICLLTITHPALTDGPIRLSTDPTERLGLDPLYYGTTSRGAVFIFVGAQVTIPDDKDRAPPSARIMIMDINQDIIPLVRTVSRPPPRVKMEWVLSDDLDTVEIDIPTLDMINVEYNRESVSFECIIDMLTIETYPALTFSPAYFPALF